MSTIEIREYHSTDCLLARDVFNLVFSETFSAPLPEFETVTKGEKIYLACCQGEIMGLASVWEPERFIHYLFVASDYRHQGVGRRLVSYLVELYGTLNLKCLISNKSGLAFYQATGWEMIGEGESDDGAYVLLSYSKHSHKHID